MQSDRDCLEELDSLDDAMEVLTASEPISALADVVIEEIIVDTILDALDQL